MWVSSSKGRSLCFLIFCLLAYPSLLPAAVTINDPGRYVIDTAGIIDDGVEQQLEGWLTELTQKTTAQVKVLTVPTMEEEDIFSFSQRHAELWKLGQAKKDNGALIVLAIQERRVRVHTGYGLEGTLPDAWIGSASRDIAGHYFKQEKYTEGIAQLTVAVANKIADTENIKLTGIPDYRYQPRRQRSGATSWIGTLLPFVIILYFMFSEMSRRRGYNRWGGASAMGMGRGSGMDGLLPGLMMGSMLGGRRSSGWRGDGFGGGGFGGGSFGGGGRFGGGGGGAGW